VLPFVSSPKFYRRPGWRKLVVCRPYERITATLREFVRLDSIVGDNPPTNSIFSTLKCDVSAPFYVIRGFHLTATSTIDEDRNDCA